MEEPLPQSNPLYRYQQNLIYNFNRILPHSEYVEEYIAKHFFLWEEEYLKRQKEIYKNILKYDKSNLDFTNNIDYNFLISEIEDRLSNIEKLSKKITASNSNIPFLKNFYPSFSEYNTQSNILLLSEEEEKHINNSFNEFVKRRFDEVFSRIDEVYRKYKKTNRESIKSLFQSLKKFDKNTVLLNDYYKQEPKLKYKQLDLAFFLDFIKIKWEELFDNINEKKIILESTSNVSQKDNNKFPNIFNSQEDYFLFLDLCDYIELDLENIKKRGNQARINAIFVSSKSYKLLRKHLDKVDYLKYFNDKYGLELKTRTISSGQNYIKKIDYFLSDR